MCAVSFYLISKYDLFLKCKIFERCYKMFNRQNKSFSLRALTGALLIVGSITTIAEVQAMDPYDAKRDELMRKHTAERTEMMRKHAEKRAQDQQVFIEADRKCKEALKQAEENDKIRRQQHEIAKQASAIKQQENAAKLAKVTADFDIQRQQSKEVMDFYFSASDATFALSQQNEDLFMDAFTVIPHPALVNLIRSTNGQPTDARIQAIINYRVQNGL